MSDQIHLMFAAATVLIMKALYTLHWSHTQLNLPAQSTYYVVGYEAYQYQEKLIFFFKSPAPNCWLYTHL